MANSGRVFQCLVRATKVLDVKFQPLVNRLQLYAKILFPLPWDLSSNPRPNRQLTQLPHNPCAASEHLLVYV
jgi:hypothetical protein